jgi:NitT/TauT family transport system ATP-binding protein
VLLKVNRLEKSFEDDKIVFSDINFSVAQKEFVSIVGPSGCGKTTLLHIIANLLQPTKGNIKFFGDNTSKGILIFQEYNKTLFPWKTVYENVEFVLRHFPLIERKVRVEKYLQMVRLEESYDKYPWQLSGGMQQRVAIARALATEPKLLLMDEPFGSLDANMRKELELQLLDLWHKLDITILLVTHDIDEAIFLSNKIIIMKGTPSKITKDIIIDIPYPRDYLNTKNSIVFREYRVQIMKCFD